MFFKDWGYWSAALLDSNDGRSPIENIADGGNSCFSQLIRDQNMDHSVFIQ